MSKKILLNISFLGILLLLSGLIFSVSFLGKFTSDGKLDSFWGIVGISLFQYFAVVTGVFLFIASIVIRYLSIEKRKLHLAISLLLFGLLIIISGVLITPEFLITRLNIRGLSDPARMDSLFNIQFLTLTAGSLIVLTGALFLRWNYLTRTRKYGLLIITASIIFYFLLVTTAHLNKRYPSNIILKPGEYSKVIALLSGRDILLSDFQPKSPLKVERKKILKAKYPVIDVHFHLISDFITEQDKKTLQPENLIKAMNAVGVKTIIGLDAQDMDKLVNNYHKKYPDRFLNFIDILSGGRLKTDEFFSNRPVKLEEYLKMGVSGIGEFPKDFGLKMRDVNGKLVAIDDPRLDPLWEKAAELGVAIVWHVADPAQFFDPIDNHNERFVELGRYPQWSYFGPEYPSKEKLFKQRENVLKKHPNTIIIGAHFGSNPHDLKYASYLLDTYPNYYIEIGSVLADLGRQPYTTREFFIKHQDKILFGTDGGSLHIKGWTIEKFYRSYFEFLETDNEYIEYPLQGAINQGDWKIYGINLPDEVLEKIYYKNAERILNTSKKNEIKKPNADLKLISKSSL